MNDLQEGDLCRINNTKKILYWNGKEWMKPLKDNLGRYSFAKKLEKQPKVKSYEIVKE